MKGGEKYRLNKIKLFEAVTLKKSAMTGSQAKDGVMNCSKLDMQVPSDDLSVENVPRSKGSLMANINSNIPTAISELHYTLQIHLVCLSQEYCFQTWVGSN